MAPSLHCLQVRPILFCIAILAACHDDDAPPPAPPVVATAPMRHAAPPRPTLPPAIIIEHDADEDAIAQANADDEVVAVRETDPVGEDDDRDSGDDIADVEDRCPDQLENTNGFEDNDGCPDPAPVESPEREPITAANGPM
jgi:hypothetical protein